MAIQDPTTTNYAQTQRTMASTKPKAAPSVSDKDAAAKALAKRQKKQERTERKEERQEAAQKRFEESPYGQASESTQAEMLGSMVSELAGVGGEDMENDFATPVAEAFRAQKERRDAEEKEKYRVKQQKELLARLEALKKMGLSGGVG